MNCFLSTQYWLEGSQPVLGCRVTLSSDGLTVGEMYSGSYNGSCGNADLVLSLSGEVTNPRGHCGLVSCWGRSGKVGRLAHKSKAGMWSTLCRGGGGRLCLRDTAREMSPVKGDRLGTCSCHTVRSSVGGDPLLLFFLIDVMKWSDRYLVGQDAESAVTLMMSRAELESDTLYLLCLSRASWPVCSVGR